MSADNRPTTVIRDCAKRQRVKLRYGCLLSLKAFCQETDLQVTLGDFVLKIRKIGKENLYLTKNQFERYEICCVKDNHNYMRTCVK